MNLRQSLNIIFAITQFFMPFFSVFMGLQAAHPPVNMPAPEVPADYTFSIWLLIFLLSLVFTVYQALPSQKDNPLFKSIGYWSATAFFSASLWMLIAQLLGRGWSLIILMIIMYICVLKVFFNTIKYPLKNTAKKISESLFGIFSGWLTFALFLNVASTIKAYFAFIPRADITILALLVILLACAAGLFITIKSKGNIWYTATTIWVLFGILATNIFTVKDPYVALASAGLISTISAAAYFNSPKTD